MAGSRSRDWQWTVWIVFLLALAGAGALPFDGLRRQPRVLDQGITNSNDRLFATDLLLPNGSQRIEECLREMQPGDRVAVLFRLGTYQTAGAQLIALAAWQRGCKALFFPSDAPDVREQVAKANCKAMFHVDGGTDWGKSTVKLSAKVSFARLDP